MSLPEYHVIWIIAWNIEINHSRPDVRDEVEEWGIPVSHLFPIDSKYSFRGSIYNLKTLTSNKTFLQLKQMLYDSLYGSNSTDMMNEGMISDLEGFRISEGKH